MEKRGVGEGPSPRGSLWPMWSCIVGEDGGI